MNKSPLDYPCPTCKVPVGVACVIENFGSVTPRQLDPTRDVYSHHARVKRAARKSLPKGKK